MKLCVPTVLAVLVSSVASQSLFPDLRLDDSLLLQPTLEPQLRVESFAEELYFNQTVDHYYHWNKDAKFKQRYFKFDQHYRPGGPIFLFVGGAGELSSLWATHSLLAKAAQIHGGAVYALEHRYYGKSMPFQDLSTQNLWFLSSGLAVEDIANFIEHVDLPQTDPSAGNKGSRKGQTSKPKWILVSGSYGANLAAWTKLKHSDLVYGVIASSAPVEAEEHFTNFDKKMGEAIKKFGGELCLKYYDKFYDYLDKTLGSYSSKEGDLLSKFGCSRSNDRKHFAETLNFDANLVQNNDPNSKDASKSIAAHCQQLNLKGSIQDIVDEMATKYKKSGNTVNCANNFDMSFLRNTKPKPESYLRQWLYQTCTQFGFFRVDESGSISTRSTYPKNDYYKEKYCRYAFGENLPELSTFRVNDYFLGKSLNLRNVVFTNGEYDPWSTLSILPKNPTWSQWGNNEPNAMLTFVIEGAGHATDLTQVSVNDSESVKQAKERNLKIIEKWVKGDTVYKKDFK